MENIQKEADTKEDGDVQPEVAINLLDETFEILKDSAKSPYAALLLLSAKIEEQLRKRLIEANIPLPRNPSMVRLAELGVKDGIFPYDFLPAVMDFASVRNQVAHGRGSNIHDNVA